MPVRNGMPFLPQAVRSTLAAMPQDAELVVLNDGSHDGTADFLCSLRDRRLRVEHRALPGGVAAGLNSLLRLTDSEHVARMDADDICLPWRFTLQSRSLRRVDLVFSSVVFMNGKGRLIRPDLPGQINSRAVPLHLLLGNCLVHPTMYANRACLESLGGYRQTAAEDYDLWLRAAYAGLRIIRTATPGLLYRKHKAQLSATGGWLGQSEDPLLDDSYQALLEQLVGPLSSPRQLRLSVASGRNLAEDQAAWNSFLAALTKHADGLGPAQRSLARLRLQKARMS